MSSLMSLFKKFPGSFKSKGPSSCGVANPAFNNTNIIIASGTSSSSSQEKSGKFVTKDDTTTISNRNSINEASTIPSPPPRNSQRRRGKIGPSTLAHLLEIPGMTEDSVCSSVCSAHLLSHSDPNFDILREYIRNSQEDNYGMKVLSIISLDRFDDYDFEYDVNIQAKKRLLLSFGAGSNFLPNIVRNGFQPVPVGGIHFADRCSKSANCCDSTFPSSIGYLIFCEVAVGVSFLVMTPPNYTTAPSILQEDGKVIPCESVLCEGKFVPDEEDYVTLGNGCVIPLGKSVTNTKSLSCTLDHNQYIIYSGKLVKIRYLAKIEFTTSADEL